MGKLLKIALKVKGFTFYPFILREPKNKDGKPIKGAHRGINIRIVKDQKTVFDVECHDEKLVRITATDFQHGYITGGWSPDLMNDLNAYIKKLMNHIRDFIAAHDDLSKDTLMASLYGSEFRTKHKKRRRKYVTIPVLDYKGIITTSYELEKDEIKELLKPHLTKQTFKNSDGTEQTIEGIFDPETGENAIQSEEDFYDVVTVLNEEKIENEKIKAELEALEKMAPAERYKAGKWNKENIFECLGYLRYGTKTNAAKKEVPVLASKKWHSDFKKFILFRQNTTEPISENTKDFNTEWVHAYYRFIINQNNPAFKKLPEASPFKVNPAYKVEGESEAYGKNTFIDNIHKGMKRYIQELYENNLIKEDFSKKIDAEAFVDGSDYGEKIHFITVKEFLQIYKADLPKGSKLDKTRDAFISLCIMGERKSDYKADKLIQAIDHFKLSTFRQPKTGTLLNNVLLKPMAKLEQKYKGKLPVITQSFNVDLRELIKHIGIQRTIQVPIKKVGEDTVYESKELSELISSKFGRSTFYLIGGVLGKSFEELRLMAGHKSINIAMKHYWELAKNYTEKDLQELLNIYK